jgi:hypothetical protein
MLRSLLPVSAAAALLLGGAEVGATGAGAHLPATTPRIATPDILMSE